MTVPSNFCWRKTTFKIICSILILFFPSLFRVNWKEWQEYFTNESECFFDHITFILFLQWQIRTLCIQFRICAQKNIDVTLKKGNYSTVKLLLSKGAEMKLCNNDGIRPLYLHVACKNWHNSTIQLLLSKEAELFFGKIKPVISA